MFSIFLLNPAGLWNLCPDLSIYDLLRLDSVDMKTDSIDSVKKVLL